jgi:glycosyltransferase involved in cell wall biosynthesis
MGSIPQPQRVGPLRVLHLVAMLHNGGAERWVVDLCQAGRSENISMDIAVLDEIPGIFDKRARERGIPIYHCPRGNNSLQFVRNVRRLLRERGPYAAIHSHIHALSCFVTLAARLEGVPIRVVHSHNVVGNSSGSWGRRGYLVLARAMLRMFATAGFAPSSGSLEDLFGEDWRTDPRWRVLPYGIDLSPFSAPIEAMSTRAAFGIPPGSLVLGSIGRLTAEKNSEFLVDVLSSVLRHRPDAYLLLVGDGPLRGQLERKAREGGYGDRLVLTGPRSDVPALLRNVPDVFVFPSPPPPRGNEALAIAVVEAQAAGLPCVISDGIPPEAILVPELVMQIKADAGADKWAEAVMKLAGLRDPDVARRALGLIEQSGHNCTVSVKSFAALYRGAAVP